MYVVQNEAVAGNSMQNHKSERKTKVSTSTRGNENCMDDVRALLPSNCKTQYRL